MQCFGRLCKKRSKQLDVPSDHDLALNQQDAVEVRSYETFRVRFAADIATFSGEDGSKIDVPLYALHRSTQLTDVFGCTTDTSTSGIRIVLPTGVLHSWICSLHDLRLLKEDVARPAKHGSRGENGLVSESIPLIKAADFLNDSDCLNQLAARLGGFLFPTCSTDTTHAEGVLALTELPEDLLLHVLAACQQPFSRHLQTLPVQLHMAAMHASHPTICSSSALHVQHLKSEQQVRTLAPLIAQLTTLKGLTVSGRAHGHRCSGDVLVTHAQQLMQLQQLAVNRLILSAQGANTLARLLQSLYGLQELSLAGTFVEHNGSEYNGRQALLAHISCLKCLRVLDLHDTQLGDDGARALTHSFAHLPTLRTLCLASNLLSSSGLWALAARVTFLKLLEDLDLSHNKYSPPEPPLPVLPPLKTLNLAHSCISTDVWGGTECTKLLSNIESFTALESLNLSFNSVALMGLLPKISSLCSLRTLLLCKCDIQHPDHKHELKCTLATLTRLQKLDLGDNALHSSTAHTDVLQSICELQHLTWLCLSHVGGSEHVTTAGLAGALFSLQQHQRLQHLDISRNMFSRSEAEAVLEALEGLATLHGLNISLTNLLSEAVSVIFRNFTCSSLERLELEFTKVWVVGGAALLAHIGSLSRLKSLNLGNNLLSEDAAVASLVDCIGSLRNLTHLGLKNCKLGDTGVLQLAGVIENLNALRELNVRDNKFSEMGWGALVRVLGRGCEVVCLYADKSIDAFIDRCPLSMHHVDVVTRRWHSPI